MRLTTMPSLLSEYIYPTHLSITANALQSALSALATCRPGPIRCLLTSPIASHRFFSSALIRLS